MKLLYNPNCYCYYIIKHLDEWEKLVILKDDLYNLVVETIKPAKDYRKKKIFLSILKNKPNIGAMLDYMRCSCKAAARLESN